MIGLGFKIDVADALKALDDLTAPTVPAQVAGYVADQVVLPAQIKYPPPSRAKMTFASDKSRRYFFAALRDKAITVPYQRTGDLGREWDKQDESDGVTLTSRMPYSDLVRTKGQQAKYFAGNWDVEDDLINKLESDVTLAATAAIVQIIGNAGP